MDDETLDRKASNFVIILEYKSGFFFSCCSTIFPSRFIRGKDEIIARNEKQKELHSFLYSKNIGNFEDTTI